MPVLQKTGKPVGPFNISQEAQADNMEVTSSILSLSFQQKERPLQCQLSGEADKDGPRQQCLYQDGHHVCWPAAFGAGS